MPRIVEYTKEDLEMAEKLSNMVDWNARTMNIAYALSAARENGRIKALLGVPEPKKPPAARGGEG